MRRGENQLWYAWLGAAVPLVCRLPGIDIGKSLLLGIAMSPLPGVSLLGHVGGFFAGVPLGAAARGDAAFRTVATIVGGLAAVVFAVRLFIG